MTRGKKTEAAKPAQRRGRKPYPTAEERLQMAERQIARLQALNQSREALIARTEETLRGRRAALEKSTRALEQAAARRERLLSQKQTPPPAAKQSLTPEALRETRLAALEKAREARRVSRESKKREREKYERLMEGIRSSGKNVDDWLREVGLAAGD